MRKPLFSHALLRQLRRSSHWEKTGGDKRDHFWLSYPTVRNFGRSMVPSGQFHVAGTEFLKQELAENELPLQRTYSLRIIGRSDNGYLTPTLKVRRSSLDQHFVSRFNTWEQMQRTVIWLERL
jgi:hypothetical protein